MLRKIYNKGWFDYKKFILDNLKRLSITSCEAIVLIKMLDNYSKTDVFDSSSFDDLGIKSSDLDKVLSNLLDRGFYELYLKDDNNKSCEAISLNGFFDKASGIINTTVEYKEELPLIINLCQEGLNKILTSTELDIITSLYEDDNYSFDEFKNAIDDLNKSKKALNVKALATNLSLRRNAKKSETPKYVKEFINNIRWTKKNQMIY